MKILGISCSNRKDGNSYLLLREMLKDIHPHEAKIIQIAELQITPCELCFDLCAPEPFKCAIEDDFEMFFKEMKWANAIIIACPFYFYMPSKFQAFLERISCVDYFTQERHKEKSPLTDKPCLLIAVSASGSSFNAFQILHHLQEFALMFGMRPISVDTWPFIGFSAKCGFEKGAVLKEGETIQQAKRLVNVLIEKK